MKNTEISYEQALNLKNLNIVQKSTLQYNKNMKLIFFYMDKNDYLCAYNIFELATYLQLDVNFTNDIIKKLNAKILKKIKNDSNTYIDYLYNLLVYLIDTCVIDVNDYNEKYSSIYDNN